MPPPLPAEWAAATDTGRMRRENQDRWWADPSSGVFAVADGMGGMPCGAEAAEAALAALAEECAGGGPASPEAWRQRLLRINERVVELGEQLSPSFGIGTTLTVAAAAPGGLVLAHVGDSACLRWRGGRLQALTSEHTSAAEAARRTRRPAGDFASAGGNVLTRCIGLAGLTDPEVLVTDVRPGDRFLLATDGVTKVVPAARIAGLLGTAATAHDAAQSLVSAALARGGPDNATALALWFTAG